MAEKTKKAAVEPVEVEPSFTKKQIIKSRKYSKWVDYLNANLSDKKQYTHAELKAMLKKTFNVEL